MKCVRHRVWEGVRSPVSDKVWDASGGFVLGIPFARIQMPIRLAVTTFLSRVVMEEISERLGEIK